MQTITAIKIDALNLAVEEIKIENELEHYYQAIGCELIEKITIDTQHDLIVDEEARLYTDRINFGFRFIGMEDAFIGNGLIVGYNATGNWISHNANLETVRALVEFVDIKPRKDA